MGSDEIIRANLQSEGLRDSKGRFAAGHFPVSPECYPQWDNAEDCARECQAYFDSVSVPTVSGLCIHLGFWDRNALNKYLNRTSGIFNPCDSVIKKAYNRIINFHESNLAKPACAGSIFALKVLDKWQESDKVEVDVSVRLVREVLELPEGD